LSVFSIITPSCNQLDWLRLCIASVRDQVTLQDPISPLPALGSETPSPFAIEHIIQDSGTQGIADFARELGAEFHCNGRMVFEAQQSTNYLNATLKIFSESDTGMYQAINRGLSKASGHFCAWLNSDEQYLPRTLYKVYQTISKKPNASVIFGDVIALDSDFSALCYWRPYKPSALHLETHSLNLLSSSLFFSRKLFCNGHRFDEKYKAVADMLWIKKIIKEKHVFTQIKEPLSVFAVLGSNLGSSPAVRGEFDKATPKSTFLLKAINSALHFGRKIFSGAYARRDIAYSVFTINNPKTRTRFFRNKIGWKWPKC
jgi:glycosyltransferase involved in cell wall biosynthesis